MATKKAENKKQEFVAKDIFALWKRTSKNGDTYFSGKTSKDNGEMQLRGFFNTNKKNPKEPDLRVYVVTSKGELSKEPLISMWCNVSKNSKKYLTGKIEDKRVVAFINDKANEKQPYVVAYYSEDKKQEPIDLPKEEVKSGNPF